MVNELKYDIVIIGGGPSGSSVAYYLSKKKMYKIALIEARTWENVWGKPCGNAIGAHHFSEGRFIQLPTHVIKQEINGVEIYSPKEDVVLRVYGKGYIIDRTRLGQYLLKSSQDYGVDVFLSSHARKLIVKDGKVEGVEATIKNENVVIKGMVIIDASGSSGALRTKLPSDLPVSEPLDPKDSDLAFREILILENEIDRPDFIRIYLNQEIAPGGYWWLFPEGKNEMNLGLGVQNGVGNPDPRTMYRSYLIERAKTYGIIGVKSSAGAIVPTRRPLDSLVWNGFVVIGDSAFTVNPVHGGGMGYSIESAYCASIGIDEAFERGDFTLNGLWKTNVCYMRNVGAKQAALELLRIFLQKLSDAELQFVMEKGIVREEDVDILSRRGELTSGIISQLQSSIGDLVKILKSLTRPSLLLKLKKLSDNMDEIKRLYREYPEDPNSIDIWRNNVGQLISTFNREIG